MPQQVSLRHPSILDLYHFSLDCFESCSQNPDALSITATGNTKWIEAARAGCFRKTRKRHRSKQQQFLSSNSTCSQIGTSCSLAVSSNSHHCHSATTAALPFLLLLATNFVLFFFFFFSFCVQLHGHIRKLPGELKAPGWTTDLQRCCFSSFAALAIVLNSSRGPTLSGESASSLHSSLWSLDGYLRKFIFSYDHLLLCMPVFTQLRLGYFKVWIGSNYTHIITH